MNLQRYDLYIQGTNFGRVRTAAAVPPRTEIRVHPERLSLPGLAQLTADLLGEEQPYLLPPTIDPAPWDRWPWMARPGVDHVASNMARWMVRLGCKLYGRQAFLRAVARALVG